MLRFADICLFRRHLTLFYEYFHSGCLYPLQSILTTLSFLHQLAYVTFYELSFVFFIILTSILDTVNRRLQNTKSCLYCIRIAVFLNVCVYLVCMYTNSCSCECLCAGGSAQMCIFLQRSNADIGCLQHLL